VSDSSESEGALLNCTFPGCKRSFLDDAARAAHFASVHAVPASVSRRFNDNDYDDSAKALPQHALSPLKLNDDDDDDDDDGSTAASDSQDVSFGFALLPPSLTLSPVQQTTCPVCMAVFWTPDALSTHLETEVPPLALTARATHSLTHATSLSASAF
jgi:hypothetical protein